VKSSVALVTELINPVVEALGLELWGIEHVQQSGQSLLRIFIERGEGVTIEDCEKVSRQVSAILDVEDPIAGEYTLEVSSPGIDRPLFTPEQFKLYEASEVNIKLRNSLNGRRRFKGTIIEVSGEDIVVRVDGEDYQLHQPDIEKAQLVY
jgi:ribosome maturation factor RimP